MSAMTTDSCTRGVNAKSATQVLSSLNQTFRAVRLRCRKSLMMVCFSGQRTDKGAQFWDIEEEKWIRKGRTLVSSSQMQDLNCLKRSLRRAQRSFEQRERGVKRRC